MNCRLLSLKLRNFKGFEAYDFEPDGHSVVVHGTNGAGKTTLADAYYWLLFGQDSKGKGDFDVKPKDGLGRDSEVAVTGEFDLGGRKLVLRRATKENWVSPRGASTKVLRGHKTSFEVDGVPKTAREYGRAIEEIMLEKGWRLVSDPTEFGDDKRVPWKARRDLLTEICGGVNDAEVIASDPELVDLAEILGDRSIDDQRAVFGVSAKRKLRDRDAIPARIAEATRLVVKAPACGEETLQGEMDLSLKARQRLIQAHEALREECRGKADWLATLRRSIGDEEIAARKKAARDSEELRSQAAAAKITFRADFQAAEFASTQKETALQELEDAKAAMFSSVDEYGRLLPGHDPITCGSCGQQLPPGQITDLNASAKIKVERSKDAYATLAEKAGDLTNTLQCCEASLAASEEALSAAERAQEDVERPADSGRLSGMRAEEAALREILGSMTSKVDAAPIPGALDLKIAEQKGALLALAVAKQQASRVAQLMAAETELSVEIETAERGLYLIDKYETARVRLLQDKINAMFETVSFVMFRDQVNGGLEERCDVEVDGVRYGNSLNHGAEVLAGLLIIGVLQEHFDFAPTVWVDGRESLVLLPAMGCQVISLRVSEEDKQLRMEQCNGRRGLQSLPLNYRRQEIS